VCGGERAHEILPHDLCIYLLFWIRFLQVTQMARKTHVPWDIFQTSMRARTIYFYIMSAVRTSHTEHLTQSQCEPVKIKSVDIGQSWLYLKCSVAFRLWCVCVRGCNFLRFCREINRNLHFSLGSDTFMTTHMVAPHQEQTSLDKNEIYFPRRTQFWGKQL
jgi:hypothetical protein